MSAIEMQGYDRFSLKVYGYDDTLFAAKPSWATASVIVVDETIYPDGHDVGGLIEGRLIGSDPFQTPYWFDDEEQATAAAKNASGLEFVDAVKSLEAARATAARRHKYGPPRPSYDETRSEPMSTPKQQLEYVAIIRDVRAGTTTREYFRAPDYQEAKARYAGRGNVDSHVGPIAIQIVGVMPISVVKRGEVVTILNPDDSVGEIGHVVSKDDNAPSVRCFFE